MQRPDVMKTKGAEENLFGYAHIAISVGSEDAVNTLTKRLVDDGYTRMNEPRTTGDGYYESVLLDPDGNLIEITI
jgi:lactoylglutathione lyase